MVHMKELWSCLSIKEPNSKESLSLWSFLVIVDIKSNIYFANLYIGEPIWDMIGLYFGRPSINASWISRKPYKPARHGASGMNLIFMSWVMAFFSYKISNKLSTNLFL